MNPEDELAFRVTDSVGYTIAGALLGWAIVTGLNKTTPLRSPWWLGIAVGAALTSAAQWHKERL